MPAVLFSDAPVLPARRQARSSFDQVAVADWDVLPFWKGAKNAAAPPKAMSRIQVGWAQPSAKKTVIQPAAELDAQLVEWLLAKALKEAEAIRCQWPAKATYFEGIRQEDVSLVAGQLAIWLWNLAKPVQLTTTLTYDQSLHVRAALPQGAVHIAVLFSPGVDPNATIGLGEEEEDNTVASVYDAHGTYLNGAVGPLPQVLAQLAGLLPLPASR